MRFISFILLFLSLSAASQGEGRLHFENIGARQGLQNSFIIDIAVDGQGFVWAGSENGLTRIAGHSLTTFTTENSTLPDNKVAKVHYVKSTNEVWCLTFKGICIFDCDTQSFDLLNTSNGLLAGHANGISDAQDGGLWLTINGKGIQHYDPLTKESVYYTKETCTGLNLDVRSCAEDRYGKLYIAYGRGGLGVMDLHKRTVKNYRHEADNEESLPSDNLRDICIDSRDNVWIATNQGLALMDIKTGTFRSFKHERADPHSLSGDNIMGVKEMADHTLWVAADLGGISVLDLDKVGSEGYSFTQITDRNSPLSSLNIRSLAQDYFGNVWVANYSTGVDFISGKSSQFSILPFYRYFDGEKRLRHVYAVAADKDGGVWLGSENELALFRGGLLVKTWDMSPALHQTYTIPYIMKVDSKGLVWIGLNDDGVIVFDPARESFRRISSDTDYFDVHAFLEDSTGKMWIGTELGLFSWHDGAFDRKEMLKNLPPSSIYGLEQDSAGRLWIGTLGSGLYVADTEKNIVLRFHAGNSFCSNNINQIFRDKDGGMWIATYNGLVHVPDPSHETETILYNGEQGLSSLNVRGIQQDAMGTIWISTYDGISCLNPRALTFDNYNYFDGSSIGSFVEGSATMDTDGAIYFGSPDGVCYFNPQQRGDVSTISPLQFVNCEMPANNTDKWEMVTGDLLHDKSIHMKHGQNSFRISFTTEDYSQADRVLYSYRLVGYVDDWIDNGNKSQVSFWNLKAGKYTLQIKARLQDQSRDEEAYNELRIVIGPPIWASIPALVLYTLIVFAILYFILRYIRLRISLKLEKQKSEGEQKLNEERLRFFTNITHELRTPLTLILAPLDDLTHDKSIPEPYSSKIASIHKSGQRLLSLVNQILDFRKTETQNKELVIQRGDLHEHIKEIGTRHIELSNNADVKVVLKLERCGEDIYFDPEIVTAIVENFMSNALKYTTKGTITLSLAPETIEQEEYCTISVSDTGCGIEKENLPMIFDRYYQVKGKHQASGTGIGLALAKSLAEIHKGKIHVQSKKGEGSVFSFSIRSGYTYPEALHRDTESAASDVMPVQISSPDEELESVSTKPIILVIEDNPDMLGYIADILDADFKVHKAQNGKKGLEKSLSLIPDLIISDIMMPEMDGISMCRKIKSDVRTAHIPVILLTAKGTSADMEEGYENGADSYLTKPFTSSLLRSRIDNLFENRKKLAQRIMSALPVETEVAEAVFDKYDGLRDADKEFLKKFDSMIEENLDRDDFDMTYISSSFNMSYSTFYRKIKGICGVNAKEYIRTVKLQKAMALLKSGNYNVSEVSTIVGYNNIGNFSKSFKKQFGESPSSILHTAPGPRVTN